MTIKRFSNLKFRERKGNCHEQIVMKAKFRIN